MCTKQTSTDNPVMFTSTTVVTPTVSRGTTTTGTLTCHPLHKGLNTTPGPDQLYAQSDKSNKSGKKQGKQQQLQSVTDSEQLYTQPNKAHAAGVHTVEEGTEAAPQLPPPYVPDEEQYYNTRGGAGPPKQEGMYDYAAVDRQQK